MGVWTNRVGVFLFDNYLLGTFNDCFVHVNRFFHIGRFLLDVDRPKISYNCSGRLGNCACGLNDWTMKSPSNNSLTILRNVLVPGIRALRFADNL